MKVLELNDETRPILLDYYKKRYKLPFPPELFSSGGIAVEHKGTLLGGMAIYIEMNAKIAVLGFLVCNPDNTPKQSYQAAKTLLEFAPLWIKAHGIVHVISMFGNRGLNRILDKAGFQTADIDVEEKYLRLK